MVSINIFLNLIYVLIRDNPVCLKNYKLKIYVLKFFNYFQLLLDTSCLMFSNGDSLHVLVDLKIIVSDAEGCWDSLCLRRSTFLWKAFSQRPQEKGLYPVCLRMCVMRFEDWLNAFEHTTHLWGFSPATTRGQIRFYYMLFIGFSFIGGGDRHPFNQNNPSVKLPLCNHFLK